MADSHREEIAKLETLYANNPEGRVFTHLAEAYRKAGELDRAREILEDGLRRHSDYSSAHVVLGRVLADQGEPEGATAAFRRVLELDRHNLVALRSLGEISAETGRTDEALHYYRELLSLDPSDERLRGTVRNLEERRDEQAAAAFAAPAPEAEAPEYEPEPAAAEETAAEAPLTEPSGEPSGEPPAWQAGEPVHTEPVAEAEFPTPEPAEFVAGPAVPFHPEAVVEPPAAEGPPSYEAVDSGAVSENWEEDVGIELEPLPGDLGALAGEEPPVERLEGLERSAGEEEWAVTSEWLAQPPADPLASGLDLGIEGEEVGRIELPASDLELTEPAGADLTPFDIPSGPLDLAADEPNEPTPFETLDTADAAEVPPETVFGAVGAGEGLDMDIGPVTPDFGGPAAPPETQAWEQPRIETADGELVTETMAELYFAQGAYGRAADVYRSLLLGRPDDARLQERLAEAESRSAAPSMEEEDAGEAWLEGVESAWTGGGGVAGAEETPYAWAEPSADEAPAGPRVGDYFRTLLSWRPGAEGMSAIAEPAQEALAETEPAGGEHLAYEAAETEAPAYLPMEMVEEEAGEDEAHTAQPWEASEPGRPPEMPEAASVAGADEEGAEDDEDLEMFRSWLQSLRK